MNEILKMRLFALFSEASQVTNEEIQNAYGNFVKHVQAVGSENDYTKIYRNLSITRIELATLETVFRYEQEKKCPEICVFSKSVISCQF